MPTQAPLTLETVLYNTATELFHEFAAFLQQTFCIENLVFWMAVRHYQECAQRHYQLFHDNPASNTATLQAKCLAILDTHIQPNSPQEINIPCDMRQQILADVRDGNYHPAIFDTALEAVVELMRANSFIPWLTECAPTYLPKLPRSSSMPTSFHPDKRDYLHSDEQDRPSFSSCRSGSSGPSTKNIFKRMKRTLGLAIPRKHLSAPSTPRSSTDVIRFAWKRSH
ncbi:hypothetical protein EC973_002364 [Apophysomyces ossiformis]|uniref:RGS domain-containing protein n=1 Tax=Apophysomyces ossiformis TaxID=679940 RepID=A0A8H7BGR7_9FUNG|nr:hypothetical protein EC973_002364 [Apophysomyces ossiformis]